MKMMALDPKFNTYRFAGDLFGTTFIKYVHRKNNFMRVVGGYGIQEDVFIEMIKYGLEVIIVIEFDTQRVYSSFVQDWIDHSHVGDYGNGKQRFLGMKYFNLCTKGGVYTK